MRVRALHLGLIFFVLLSAAPAPAQDTSNELMAGMNPYADYHGGDLDSISMINDTLNLHIPIFTDHSQRGKLNFTYSLDYTSTSWKAIDAPQYPHACCLIKPVRSWPLNLVIDGNPGNASVNIKNN